MTRKTGRAFCGAGYRNSPYSRSWKTVSFTERNETIGTGNLTIRLGLTQTRLLIKISDDGVGMDEQTLERLNEKLGKTVEQFDLQKNEKSGGIALVNVNNRIQLLFGKGYGMHIFSMEGVGTEVEITIPIIKNEREWKKRSV